MRNFKIHIISVVVILFSTYLQAQIYTTTLTEQQDIRDFFPYPLDKEIHYYRQPDIDFDRVLEQDRREGNTLYRVAVKVDQAYTIEDGVLSQYGDIMIWQIGFSAPKSRSLNFLITDLNLPEGSEMYMVSKDNKIVHGPVLPEHTYENSYSSDIIQATDVRIVVKTDIENYKKFHLNVSGVCQGVIYPSDLRMGFGQSGSCNFDVNCNPQGNNWQLEKDAVAVILIGNEFHCSGALVNNQCQNLRAFFLTANHCITGKNVGQFTFRFRYEAGNPLCPGQQPANGNQGNWFTIPGSILRANNAATDFALLELNGNLHFNPAISFAGWNRVNQAPTNTTIIHHPAGDCKKITFDNNQATQAVFGSANCWFLITDIGATEGGSSGSPYFDQNRRIVGQHFGINQESLPICDRTNRFGGRFDLSWTGGGTNATRLSNWLGGANPPTTTNTIRAAHITPFVANNGTDFLCTTNRTFTLTNQVPGTTVTWSVNNTFLFVSGGGASTSGTGINAILRGASSVAAGGEAILTFIMSNPGCGTSTTITRRIWVGRPGVPITFPAQYSTTDLGLGQSSTVYLSSAPGAQNFTANWTPSGAVSIASSSPSTQAIFVGNYVGSGSWTATTSNACNTTGAIGYFNVTSGGGGGPLRVLNVPNPTSQSFICHLPEGFLDDLSTKAEIKVIDSHGNEIISAEFIGLQKEINAETWPTGMYFTKVNTSNGVLWGKVLIIK